MFSIEKLKNLSTANRKIAKIIVAIATTVVDCCKSFHFGNSTL